MTQQQSAHLAVLPSLSKVTELKNGVAQLNENKELVLDGAKTAVNGMYSGLANVSYALDTQIIPGMSTRRRYFTGI